MLTGHSPGSAARGGGCGRCGACFPHGDWGKVKPQAHEVGGGVRPVPTSLLLPSPDVSERSPGAGPTRLHCRWRRATGKRCLPAVGGPARPSPRGRPPAQWPGRGAPCASRGESQFPAVSCGHRMEINAPGAPLHRGLCFRSCSFGGRRGAGGGITGLPEPCRPKPRPTLF